MTTIHMMLQGKGGVGKSLAAAILAQYLLEKRAASKSPGKIVCVDTDPVNTTFANYRVFNAEPLKLMDENQKIDTRVFDELVEKVLGLGRDDTAVIDNGASTFVPLAAYLTENNVFDLLKGEGKKLYIHTVLTGGQALDDTLAGLEWLLANQPCPLVVWLNEYFGDIVVQGQPFASSTLAQEHKKRLAGTVTIARRDPATFGKDVEILVANQLTFDEGQADTARFGVMPRQRLKIVKNDLFQQLDKLGL